MNTLRTKRSPKPTPAKSRPIDTVLPRVGSKMLSRVSRLRLSPTRDVRWVPSSERSSGLPSGVDVADAILADPVHRVPARVLPDGVAEPDVAAERVDRVVGQDAPGVEDVEAGRQGPVEEPGLGEADGAGLEILAAAQAEEHLPALAEEVALREVESAEDAVLRAVAAADREEAGGLLGHVDVDDDLVLGRARERSWPRPCRSS